LKSIGNDFAHCICEVSSDNKSSGMREALLFFLIITFCSCGERTGKTVKERDTVSTSGTNKPGNIKANEIMNSKPKALTTDEWQKQEDSLRNVILQKRDNKILKESFLQELYIRNAVSVSKDSLFFRIPFDLHGCDCIAPDCYSTNVSFGFRFRDSLLFPQLLPFEELEEGCIDKKSHLTGNLKLIEQSDNHVIYHSTRFRRTLVLFRSNQASGTTAYYFTKIGQNRINGKNVYTIMKEHNEEDKNSICPFMSWKLLTNEYENFLR